MNEVKAISWSHPAARGPTDNFAAKLTWPRAKGWAVQEEVNKAGQRLFSFEKPACKVGWELGFREWSYYSLSDQNGSRYPDYLCKQCGL